MSKLMGTAALAVVLAAGIARIGGCAPAQPDSSTPASVQIPGMSFAPEPQLKFLKLPLWNYPPLAGLRKGVQPHLPRDAKLGMPMLQSASQMASIVAWAEAIYYSPRVLTCDDGTDFLAIVADGYSGVEADDVFVFIRTDFKDGLPWKLVSAKSQAYRFDRPDDDIAGVRFDRTGKAIVLTDLSGKTALKIDVQKAYQTLIEAQP